MDLDNILQNSFPNHSDIQKIKDLFNEDVARNNLGMRSHLKNNKIYFYFPITMIIGIKV
jgi:hypothetical protein